MVSVGGVDSIAGVTTKEERSKEGNEGNELRFKAPRATGRTLLVVLQSSTISTDRRSFVLA